MLGQQLARKGLERSSEFSWEKAVGKTWQVYQELLDTVRSGLALVFFDRDFQRLEKLVILRSQLDPAGGFELALGRRFGLGFHLFLSLRIRRTRPAC